MSRRRLTLEAARRTALAASGLHAPRPRRVDAGSLRRTFERLSVVQIDSVARVARAHYLPFFSRLGPYDAARLDTAFATPPPLGVEYWSHEAAFAPGDVVAGFHRRRAEWYRRDFGQRDPDTGAAFLTLMGDVEAAVADGPATARQLSERVEHRIPERPKDHWGWNHSHVKRAAEALFHAGRLSALGRNQHFERRYALPGDVDARLPVPELTFGPPHDRRLGLDPRAGRLPRGISGIRDDLSEAMRRAARALGVGSLDCFADYYRAGRGETADALQRLVDDGELIAVDVEGRPAYLWHAAVVPRRVDACALLAPFDPLVFNRRRLAWLFGMDYRIEIYTPAERRVYGYYVLPFLCGERMVGRVDLAAERAAGRLVVTSVHWEADVDAHQRAACSVRLRAELEALAAWLGLATITGPGADGITGLG